MKTQVDHTKLRVFLTTITRLHTRTRAPPHIHTQCCIKNCTRTFASMRALSRTVTYEDHLGDAALCHGPGGKPLVVNRGEITSLPRHSM